jgi:hypothetical protein
MGRYQGRRGGARDAVLELRCPTRGRAVILPHALSHRWHGDIALLIDFIDHNIFLKPPETGGLNGVNFASSD